MTGLFLQCRLDSTRLPGKAILPLGGEPLISRVMEALKGVKVPIKVLLTTEDSRKILLPLAESAGFKIFTGPKDDVLERYLLAARYFGVDEIVRATGDNPYVSSILANRILDLHREKSADYSGFLGMPLGTGVEILKTEALEKAARESHSLSDHEHVAPYLYNNPDKFILNRPNISDSYGFENVKISVDTEKDLMRAEKIFSDCGHEFPLEIDRLMEWVRKQYA